MNDYLEYIKELHGEQILQLQESINEVQQILDELTRANNSLTTQND